MNQLVIKSTANYGITFSLEWSYSDIANRWTCYEMYNNNWKGNAGRNDSFREDSIIPKQYRSKKSDYSGSGFDRGHLCPSGDRQCTVEQNKQTFYLSNMHPQYGNHNQILWNNLEAQVRDWADADDCDTLYVVKAATIRSDQVTYQLDKTRLPIPKYFYMAILSYNKSTDSYKAIGIWTVHNNDKISNKNFGDYAISIDELEEKTGIDFFCNLPDDIEDEVERKCEKVNIKGKWYIDGWGITCTSGNLNEE